MFPGNRALQSSDPEMARPGRFSPAGYGFIWKAAPSNWRRASIWIRTRSALSRYSRVRTSMWGSAPWAARDYLDDIARCIGARVLPGARRSCRWGGRPGVTGLPLCGHIRRGGAFARCGSKALPVSRLLTSTGAGTLEIQRQPGYGSTPRCRQSRFFGWRDDAQFLAAPLASQHLPLDLVLTADGLSTMLAKLEHGRPPECCPWQYPSIFRESNALPHPAALPIFRELTDRTEWRCRRRSSRVRFQSGAPGLRARRHGPGR